VPHGREGLREQLLERQRLTQNVRQAKVRELAGRRRAAVMTRTGTFAQASTGVLCRGLVAPRRTRRT
jgi:hypothetical protein